MIRLESKYWKMLGKVFIDAYLHMDRQEVENLIQWLATNLIKV